MKNTPILIIGMARSGTTFVSNMLGSHEETCVVSEPHLLWRTGNLCSLNDQEFKINSFNTNIIRKKILDKTQYIKRLVEKSPINSLRAELVHSVFPDAKIVYLERDPVRVIFSNYKRSLKKDSFKLSIILKKYFYKTGSEDLPYSLSSFNLISQLSLRDIPCFLLYIVKMFFLRDILNLLPFGPKIKDFKNIVKYEGLLSYHAKVYKETKLNKKKFEALYKDNFYCFQIEDLMTNREVEMNLFKSVDLEYDDIYINEVMRNINQKRVEKAIEPNKMDNLIIQEMLRLNV